MRRVRFGIVTAAAMWCSMTALASASCAAASPVQLHAAVDELNEQGLNAFRSVSMSEHHTFSLSPLLRWYARYLTADVGTTSCSPQRRASLALVKALENAPDRYFGSRIEGGHPFRAIAAFGQNATINADISAGLPGPLTLPFYRDGRGTIGVRLDSAAGGVSLYMFDGTIGVIPPTMLGFKERMNLGAWKEIVAQFRPSVGRDPWLDFSLDGTSLVTWSDGAATERIDLQFESTAIHVFGTMDINSPTMDKAHPIYGRMSPWGQTLWVLVDTRTGAIIDIGANIQETEP